jgi:hypothetical protein
MSATDGKGATPCPTSRKAHVPSATQYTTNAAAPPPGATNAARGAPRRERGGEGGERTERQDGEITHDHGVEAEIHLGPEHERGEVHAQGAHDERAPSRATTLGRTQPFHHHLNRRKRVRA